MQLKENLGLFDYEENYTGKNFLKNGDGVIYCKNTKIQFKKYKKKIEDFKYLLSYNFVNNKYIINKQHTKFDKYFNFFWKVINNNKSNESNRIIKYGKLIKLGKCILVIKDSYPLINKFDNNLEDYKFIDYKKEKNFNKEEYLPNKINTFIAKENEIFCKFCYLNFNNDIDPLLNICDCIGSIKYSHLECIKEWFFKKCGEISNENYIYYNYENFFCELCKKKIPNFINYKKKKWNLIKINKTNKNYLIFEVYTRDNNNFNYKPKGVFYINFDLNKEFILGRGNDVDINLIDSSVSKINSKLSFINNKYAIEDLGSKFGTLVGPYQKITLKDNILENIQIKNINLQIKSISEKKSFCLSCYKTPYFKNSNLKKKW